ncbi:hypothetical protein [Bacillus massiliglaciei]|nr:hypothetical protein [Bacillus massiliglaciei]
MGKRTKSKRFIQQGKDSVAKHAERIPYHSTYAEAEERKMNMSEQNFGGL